MKNKRHMKKMYEPPRIMEVLGVSSWLLAGSTRGITTPGEGQGEEGGGMAKPNFWDSWDTEDLGGDETSKGSNSWDEDGL